MSVRYYNTLIFTFTVAEIAVSVFLFSYLISELLSLWQAMPIESVQTNAAAQHYLIHSKLWKLYSEKLKSLFAMTKSINASHQHNPHPPYRISHWAREHYFLH